MSHCPRVLVWEWAWGAPSHPFPVITTIILVITTIASEWPRAPAATRAGRRAGAIRHPCYSVRRAGASRVVQGGRGCADGDVSPPPPSPISTFFIFGVAGTAACVPTSADATRQVVDGWEVAGLDRDVGVWYSIVDLQGCALRPTRAIRLSGAPETLMCRSDQTGHRSRFPIHLGGSPASGWNGGYNDSEGQGEE